MRRDHKESGGSSRCFGVEAGRECGAGDLIIGREAGRQKRALPAGGTVRPPTP